VWIIVTRLPAGWFELAEFGHATGRWQFFDFDPSLTKSSVTFWSGLFGGAFLSLASHGADHMIVQRYLCAKNLRSASWALGMSGFVVFAQFALFLLIGVCLAAFYDAFDSASAPAKGDEAFMTFVVSHMGVGFKGLILAAVLAATMSNLASSFNSSASAFMGDWLQRWLPNMQDRTSLRVAQLLTLISAVIHAVVAVVAYQLAFAESTVSVVLKIAGFSTGLLLGLYVLGLVAPRTKEITALVAFVLGTAITCYVVFFTPLSGWWYTLVGSTAIVIIGLALGPLFGEKPQTAADVPAT
jgi:Na+/proline symporter